MRSPLQKQRFVAWRRAIKRDYRRPRINSERSLQASFWAQLIETLPTKRRMFVEPPVAITIGSKPKRYYPDIMICNSVSVIAVIEIKYLPRIAPRSNKDLQTLSQISKHRDQVSITNLRFRGFAKDEKVYRLTDKVLFVWAGVHRAGGQSYSLSDVPLLSAGNVELDERLLQLHAETTHGDPDVFAHSGNRIWRK